MTDEMPHRTSLPPVDPNPAARKTNAPRARARKGPLSEEERQRILRLHDAGEGTRKIAPKVGRSRDRVRAILREAGRLPSLEKTPETSAKTLRPSKLDPYRETIREMAKKNLTTTRILREIQAQGYDGKRTILAEFVRRIRAPLAPKKKTFRRFETPAGIEGQIDWSLYQVLLDGVLTWVYALAVALAYSRKTFVGFYPNDKMATLLEGLQESFSFLGGIPRRLVCDNMATVVLGRVGRDRKPIWNARFLDFATYCGFTPFLCRVRDPNRKGTVEAFFHYVERDFVRGSEFDSLEHMNRAARRWLDEVANQRRHGTTGQIPEETWRQERDFLISLPEKRYAGACEEELRQVARDATIRVRGTQYSVPAELAHTSVSVRLYVQRFEVLDSTGRVVMARPYASGKEKGRLQIDPEHYRNLPRSPERPCGVLVRLEETFLGRFPTLQDLLAGLKRRTKGLSHLHLRKLLELAKRYGDEEFLRAATKAQAHRRFLPSAVKRILEQQAPVPPAEPIPPLGARARVLALLGDIDGGSLDDYGHLDGESGGDDDGGSTDDDEGEPCHVA